MAQRRFWLMKSEPNTYSFRDLQNEEDGTAEWDGVRNYQARNTMRDDMKVGDGVLFYHSQAKPMAVVGTAIVVREGYPDDTAWDPKSEHPDPKSTPENPIWYMVDIKAEAEFEQPVTLAEIKKTSGLENMALVKSSRLSVQPVTREEWEIINRMGRNGK
jgi:predicted RNA-binding protein with PUA-like domain